jgi:20S proteasome alpha/beta subunit
MFKFVKLIKSFYFDFRAAIGLRGRDGVVLAVERLVLSKLYEPRAQSSSRIFNIDKHIGMAIGGLLADARAMADYAREECSNFRSNFGIPIPLHHLSDRLSAYMHAHTLLGSIRPFGCSLILSSYEALPQNKQAVPQLFMIDPSGLSNVLHSGPVACLAIHIVVYVQSPDSIWLRVTLAARWANPGNLRRLRSRSSRCRT